MYLVYGKHNKQSYTTTGPTERYKTTVLEMTTNTAYGQIAHMPNPLITATSGFTEDYETIVLENSQNTNTTDGQIVCMPNEPLTTTTTTASPEEYETIVLIQLMVKYMSH